MKALVYDGAWQMPLRQIDPPSPTPDDVIVAVQAVGICGSDVHGFTGSTGRRTPGIVMGHEFSGIVAQTGAAVSSHNVGDRVIVQPLATCGTCDMCRLGRPNVCYNRTLIGMHTHGAYAECVRVPQDQLYRLPDTVSWEQGAMVEPLSVAMHAVNLTPLSLMDTVVIVGAGTIGLLALLAVRLKGAGQIIVTDLSPHRLALAKQLGADIVVNIAERDPIAVVNDATGGAGAHAVIEAVGISADSTTSTRCRTHRRQYNLDRQLCTRGHAQHAAGRHTRDYDSGNLRFQSGIWAGYRRVRPMAISTLRR